MIQGPMCCSLTSMPLLEDGGDVAKVRRMMKESGVKKEPACSWVEIVNAVHLFMANDNAHP